MSDYENYAESISSFISWAHRRLGEEVKQNNKIKDEYGSRALYEEKLRMPPNLSIEEKLEYVQEVDRLFKKFDHISKAEACELAGIYKQTYYKWKREIKKKIIVNARNI